MTGKIKKEKELKNGRFYYKVMIKKDGFFTFWHEEFGSFNKDKVDEVYFEISKAKNIERS